jgi:hypothetical protein
MHLHRVTPDPFEYDSTPPGGKYLGKESDDLKASALKLFSDAPAIPVVVARFDRFGTGTNRKSDYEVLSEWQDVEEMILKFCQAGHPEALRLQAARQLAEAVKTAGWREPPSIAAK